MARKAEKKFNARHQKNFERNQQQHRSNIAELQDEFGLTAGQLHGKPSKILRALARAKDSEVQRRAEEHRRNSAKAQAEAKARAHVKAKREAAKNLVEQADLDLAINGEQD